MSAGPRSPSLRRTLIGWIALGLVVAIAAAAVATYLRARDEANVLFDHQLAQVAASVTGMPLAAPAPPAPLGADALVVEVWTRDGVDVYLSQPQQPLPRTRELGFHTVATDRGAWRVYSVLAGDQVVQVAQPMALRRELAAGMALSTILPLVAILPFLAVFVWFAIARSLAPLERLAAALSRRSSRSLAPLPDAGLPVEVQPVVQALNGLLARLDAALDAQRAFIADAAHELRTPLTAISLQAQLAERAGTDAERAAALSELRAGLDRATHLAGQLLTLAREEPGVADRPFAPVDLAQLAAEAIAEHMPLASARRIDLGLALPEPGAKSATPVVVDGDAPSLRTLLGNLVDNALRYTQEGGRVDVGLARDGDATTLSVSDSGPGIPPAEQARVFDRFYRAPGTAHVPGSGLGLAIVRSVAERHRATIALGPGLSGATGPGLAVVVRFPAAAADAAADVAAGRRGPPSAPGGIP
jgi:two-component system OmpR family sensor kinase